MSTVEATLRPDPDGTLHLPLPAELLAAPQPLIRVVATLVPLGTSGDSSAPNAATNLKGFGCLAGKISMSADFDAPLDDFREYME